MNRKLYVPAQPTPIWRFDPVGDIAGILMLAVLFVAAGVATLI